MTMVLPHTSEGPLSLRFLNQAGAEVVTPLEWEPGFLEVVTDHTDWASLELTIQSRPTDLMSRRFGPVRCVVAVWDRSPAGRYRIRVRRDREIVDRVVDVHPAKINPAELETIIEELETSLAGSVAMAIQAGGGLAGIELVPPSAMTIAGEIERIQRAIVGDETTPGLAALLPTIARRPHRMLRTHDQWTRSERARRPHVTALARSLAKPGNLGEELRPRAVPDTRVEHTYDVYENRVLKTYIGRIAGRIRRLRSVAKPSALAQLDSLGELLAASVRQAEFLREVGDRPTPLGQSTMVLSKRREYREMTLGLIAFQRGSSVKVHDAALDAPLENVPYLYELWSTLQVAHALIEAATNLGFRVIEQNWVQLGLGGLYIERVNALVKLRHPETGVRISLRPQRMYQTGQNYELRSISFTQIPDIAVEVRRPGEPVEVFILDPKYKLEYPSSDSQAHQSIPGAPKKEDIDKMHAYRDSIRRQDGSSAVRYAAILYPGPDVTYTDGLEAINCRPSLVDANQERFQLLLSSWVSGHH